MGNECLVRLPYRKDSHQILSEACLQTSFCHPLTSLDLQYRAVHKKYIAMMFPRGILDMVQSFLLVSDQNSSGKYHQQALVSIHQILSNSSFDILRIDLKTSDNPLSFPMPLQIEPGSNQQYNIPTHVIPNYQIPLQLAHILLPGNDRYRDATCFWHLRW